MAGAETTPKRSDLGVRTASAAVMLAVAGTALWLGGWWWAALILLVALGVLWEWRTLVCGFVDSPALRGLWNAAGLVYVGCAAFTLFLLRGGPFGLRSVVLVLLTVIAIDVGAYFSGRAIGGPKIAPSISPSKTWAGLFGGIVSASLVWLVYAYIDMKTPWGTCGSNCDFNWGSILTAFLIGTLGAIVAQSGDFFESWMKRHAGVKDSGSLIPGHGGLFDRVDGLLAVCFVLSGYIIVMDRL